MDLLFDKQKTPKKYLPPKKHCFEIFANGFFPSCGGNLWYILSNAGHLFIITLSLALYPFILTIYHTLSTAAAAVLLLTVGQSNRYFICMCVCVCVF